MAHQQHQKSQLTRIKDTLADTRVIMTEVIHREMDKRGAALEKAVEDSRDLEEESWHFARLTMPYHQQCYYFTRRFCRHCATRPLICPMWWFRCPCPRLWRGGQGQNP